MKEDITPIRESLSKILQLNPVTYYWIDKSVDESRQIGFIAQEVEKIFPELVKTNEKGQKAMNYSQLVSPIVKALQELHLKNIELEKENKRLKSQNEDIIKRIERLEQKRLPAGKK